MHRETDASNDVKNYVYRKRSVIFYGRICYKRNYIEGLFLSSGVLKVNLASDGKMCETLASSPHQISF